MLSLQKAPSILPDGYRKYDYLTSTNNASYIDTGICIGGVSFTLRLLWTRDGQTSSQLAEILYWVGDYNRDETFGARQYYGKVTWGGFFYKWPNSYYTADATGPGIVTDISLSWDSATRTYTLTGAVDSAVGEDLPNGTTETVKIRATQAKVRRVQITLSGTMVADLIPCTNPLGEPGMYDIIRDQFFGDIGQAGYFSVGKD